MSPPPFKSNLLAAALAAFIAVASIIMMMMTTTAAVRPMNPGTLATRLQAADNTSSPTCWESLYELQSCTSEVILFFLNGETYLGPDCCRAIYVIEHHCWPSMLASLGYTTEESVMLRGYCDASDHHANTSDHHANTSDHANTSLNATSNKSATLPP